jgi:hypothetical protein
MFNTTTDSILSVFTKTIAKLEAHADKTSAIADNERIAANEATKRALAAGAEASKARNAADKIRSLFV